MLRHKFTTDFPATGGELGERSRIILDIEGNAPLTADELDGLCERINTTAAEPETFAGWTINDMKHVRPDLDDDQCAGALAYLERKGDAGVGFN
jgi:hypothetical protein